MHRSLIAVLAIAACILPASAEVHVFAPHAGVSIASAGVKDMTNGMEGEAVFATDSGLSVYYQNGTWHTSRVDIGRIPLNDAAGPIDSMVLTVEYDHLGRLWIGYPNGLQISHGTWYETIRDQQLLKNLCINDLVRWNEEMWVATGHAGLHRYRDGEWTWYKPFGPEGLGCNEIDSMVVDVSSDSLIIGSEQQGVWLLRNGTEPFRFEPVLYQGRTLAHMKHVRKNPFGGAYIFNDTLIFSYARQTGVVPVLCVDDLGGRQNRINDVAATPHGMLLIATDDGIFGWNGTGVQVRLTTRDGIMANTVKRLFIAADGRCWFVVPGYVGYIAHIDEQPTIDVCPPPQPSPAAGGGTDGASPEGDHLLLIRSSIAGLIGDPVGTLERLVRYVVERLA